jgi:hypothetical protein
VLQLSHKRIEPVKIFGHYAQTGLTDKTGQPAKPAKLDNRLTGQTGPFNGTGQADN